MSLLQVADIAFGYGAERLFQNVTFKLNAGERAAIVAPNGAGKTTLLRIIASELSPDAGACIVKKEASLGFYRQSCELSTDGTVLDALLSGFQNVLDLRHELDRARELAASGKPEHLTHLAHTEEQYSICHGDELERRVQMIAQNLGFAGASIHRPVSSLSGGERGRLHLGVVLANRPDLLILDEPTNHLDLETILWLESHLSDYPGGVLIVSHDRAFLDHTCPYTFELGHKSFRTYFVRYSEYAIARQDDIEREREALERQQSMIAKTEEFIRKNIAGQKTKQAQSRRRMLEKLDKLERPEDTWEVAQHIRFRFAPAPRTGDIVLEASDLGATRGPNRLFDKLDLLVRRGDRLAIVGPNGCGKTTLLKLISGHGDPCDSGNVRFGSNVMPGYFDQHLGSLDSDKSAIDEIRSIRGDMSIDASRAYLARFRFWGDQPFQRVGSMSGGERSRLALAKLLLEPRNVLFLDEPTNHLDIPAAEILEEALVNFDGTVLFVSHDRRFLENVSTRVLLFRGGGIENFPSGFAQLAQQSQGSSQNSEPNATDCPPIDNRTVRRAQFEATKAASRAIQRKERRIRELEDLIEKAEQELSNTNEMMARTGDSWAELEKWTSKRKQIETDLAHFMKEWTEIGEALAALQ
ncbi:MAG: ABC-F family ATP-binding cassette domain-containing protein [Polyangiaceae bacterium]|nr:ABC-F family ATP-binding cassette domain-containing protein [Polyangiaceae bacterium]